jgi:GDP-D-mannose dehydratase
MKAGRGEVFVTRKITRAVAATTLGNHQAVHIEGTYDVARTSSCRG